MKKTNHHSSNTTPPSNLYLISKQSTTSYCLFCLQNLLTCYLNAVLMKLTYDSLARITKRMTQRMTKRMSKRMTKRQVTKSHPSDRGDSYIYSCDSFGQIWDNQQWNLWFWQLDKWHERSELSEFDTQQIDADSDVDDTILDHNDGSLPFHRLTNALQRVVKAPFLKAVREAVANI